jgi:hypothetical protein
LAWRAGGDDKAFLDAHQPVYFTFKLDDLPLALGQRTRRVRDSIDLAPQPFNQTSGSTKASNACNPVCHCTVSDSPAPIPPMIGIGRRST